MKKTFLYSIIFIMLFIFSVSIGFGVYKNKNKQNNNINAEEKKIENSVVNDSVTTVNSNEEKISPNANVILKKYYKGCGHTSKEYVELPKEFVNLTREEIEEQYNDWIIEKFSKDEIILLKNENGYCNEHYVLKEKDGCIAIYIIKENGDEELKEITAISTEYLPETDLIRVREGIKIYGQEELNSAIEDFE